MAALLFVLAGPSASAADKKIVKAKAKPAATLPAKKPEAKAEAKTDAKVELDLDFEGDLETRSQNETHPQIVVAPQAGAMDVGSRIDLAQSQFDKQLYDEAVSTLRAIADELPRAGLLLLARAFAARGDRLDEIRVLELCVVKNPKDYVVRAAYGKALIRSRHSEAGVAALQEARKLNPRYKPAYEALIKELEAKGDFYEARNVIEDMFEKFGAHQRQLYSALCRLYALDSYNEKTIETCEKAIDKDPTAAENHVYLGMALMDRESGDRAQKVLTSAAQRFPNSEPVQWALGEFSMNKKDYVTAFTYYKRAIAADVKSARGWIGVGSAAFRLQKNDEALEAFIKACKINGRDLRAFRTTMGELRNRKDLVWQGRFENGINECL